MTMDVAGVLTQASRHIDQLLRELQRQPYDRLDARCAALVDEACLSGAFRDEVGCCIKFHSQGWAIGAEVRLE